LATLLQTSSIRGGALLVDTLVWMPVPQQECVGQCEEAIRIAREIRLPATEAYAHILLAHVLGWQGKFGLALAEAEAALVIAQSIDHRMWQINAQVILGLLHLELLDFSTALGQLEQAMHNIEGMQSLYMLYLVSSALSRIYIALNQSQQAAQILNYIITPDLPVLTLAQRLVWTAYAELMLAVQHPETALDILDRLGKAACNLTEATVIPRLWYLRGKALIALQRKAEAEALLQAGYSTALASGNHPLAWRIGVEMGNLYLTQGKREDALDSFEAARTIIAQLAEELPVGTLRDHFRAQATAALPRSLRITAQKAAKRAFDGLTRREREVAALIAQGKTNHAIAESLTLSERTVEKHIENIMGKLDFNARSQIAVWAVEKNLNG
jgi:DNA-binding CsgD family transcriptional regulator